MPGRSRQPAAPTPSRASSATAMSTGPQADRGNAHAAAELANGPGKHQSAEGGMLGWFKSASSWVADKYDQTTEAVGGFLSDTKEAAGELYEAWSNTDLSYEDGKVGMTTDLDEVMDLMPQGFRDQLMLDRTAGSDNKVSVEFDTNTKLLTIRAPDLRLAGVATSSLTTGATQLQGVTIRVANHDGGIPFLDGKFSFLGYHDKADNVAVDVDVQRVLSSNVVFQGPKGPVQVAQLELGSFKLNAAGQGGLPFGEKGQTAASFAVGNATLRGVSAGDTQVGEVGVDQLAGGMDSDLETAFLQAGGMRTSNFDQGDTHLGSGSVSDLRADIKNEGGGLLGVDDKQDHIKAHVTAGKAEVGGVKTGAASVASGQAQGLSLDADVDAKQYAASVGHASGAGIRGKDFAVKSAEASALSASKNGQRVDAKLGSAKASGIDAAGATVNSASVANIAATQDGASLNASVGDVHAQGVRRGEDLALDSLDLRGGKVKRSGDELHASAKQVGLAGLRSGEAKVGSASASDATADLANGTTAVGAERIGMRDFSAFNFGAGAAEARGAQAIIGGGTTTAHVDSASVSDAVLADRVRVKRADVGTVDANVTGEDRHTQVASASMSGLTDSVTGGSVGSASLAGFTSDRHGDNLSAQVASAKVNDLALGDASVGQVAASDLAMRRVGETTSGSVGELSADRLKNGKQARVDHATVSGLQGSASPSEQSGSFQHAGAQGVAVQQAGLTASVASLSAEGGAASRKGEDVRAGVNKLGASGASFALDPSQAKSSGSSGDSGFDRAAMIRSVAARVDNADISASVPMKSGKYGSGLTAMEVDKNTQLDANLKVRDNQIVGDGTSASFSNKVDTVAWTSLAGMYVEDGALKGDVRGWFDPNVSAPLNKSLGIEHEELQSLGTYGDAAAERVNQTAKTQTPQTVAAADAAHKAKPVIADAFDVDHHTLNAHVGLSAGEIDTGVAKAKLGEEQGANEIDVKSVGGQELVVQFSRFLASALSVNVGGKSLETGTASVDQAKVNVDQRKGAGGVTGTVGGVTVEGVSYNGGRGV